MTRLGKFLFWVSRNTLYILAKVFWRVKFIGTENIPKDGMLIVASNHLSHLDPPLVGCGVPRLVTFLAKSELFETPVLGWWLGLIGQIRVDRRGGGRAALEAGEKWLEDGGVIVIFPEGTRSPTGRLRKGRTGVAVLALRTGSPVVPAAITGTFEAFGKGKKFPRPGKAIVRYGKPLFFAKIDSKDRKLDKKELEEATARIMREIHRLLPEDLRPIEGEVPDEQTPASEAY